MAYDEELATRVRALLDELAIDEPVEEKRMFGGQAFLVGGHLAVAVSTDGLLLRSAAAERDDLLAREHVAPMQMGNRVSAGWIRVGPGALADDDGLTTWVERGLSGARAQTHPS